MMRDEIAALLLHIFDRVVQKEIYEDGVDARNVELVDAVLFRALLCGEFVLVYFLGRVVRLRGFSSKVLRLQFWVLPLDFAFDELDAPDTGGAEFDFPGGTTGNWFQVADVVF